MKQLTAEDLKIAKLLNAGQTTEQIAKQFGLNRKTVERRKKSPEMVEYMEAERAGVGEAFALAKEKAREKAAAAIEEFGLTAITPAMVVSRLWQLAMLNADETRGNIIGQQQALDSIWTKCGFAGTAPRIGEGEQPEKPDVYRAEWMRKPQ